MASIARSPGSIAPGWNDLVKSPDRLPASDLDYLRAAYRAEVLSMDGGVGALLAAVDRHLAEAEVLTFVLADHGEYLGERGLFSHAHRLDPELMHIPFIVRWHGMQSGDRADTVSQVDVAATIAAILDLPTEGLSGRDLRLVADSSRMVLMEEHESDVHPLFSGMRLGPHVVGGARDGELFAAWEGGQRCVANRGGAWVESPCPEDLPRRLFRRVAGQVEAVFAGQDDPGVDEGQLRLLRSIGYVQ